MKNLEMLLVANFLLIFGTAGLLWPEKFLPLFDALLFPWAASHRTVRSHCIGAIVFFFLLVGRALLG